MPAQHTLFPAVGQGLYMPPPPPVDPTDLMLETGTGILLTEDGNGILIE